MYLPSTTLGLELSAPQPTKGFTNGVHTRFGESDRTMSTFEIYCKPDGYFTWRDWEICIEGRALNIAFFT